MRREIGIYVGEKECRVPLLPPLIRLSHVTVRGNWVLSPHLERSWERRLAKGVGKRILLYLHVSKYGLVPSYIRVA